MSSIFKHALVAVCAFNIVINPVRAGFFDEPKKTQMIQDLEVIKHHFEAGYAPTSWKKEHTNWDLNVEFERAKNEILATPRITTKQFQQIVRKFADSANDYHVGVYFFSTEMAFLPFGVKGAEGRYCIDWIDPIRLPPSFYNIQVGDEILEFDGKPIVEVVEKLKKKPIDNPTEQALAEISLTARIGMAGDSVPSGPIMIKTRANASGKIHTYQLRWAYTAEYVHNPLDFLQSLSGLFERLTRKEEKLAPKSSLLQFTPMMANPLHLIYAKEYKAHDKGLGGYNSFVPVLGPVLWTNEAKEDQEREEEKQEQGFFHCLCKAYIYQHPNGQKIGYIRIPHYMGFDSHAKEFGKTIERMQKETDALVIDQVNNFGGMVEFAYTLASMLTEEPLKTPYHQVKITQKDAFEAYLNLEFIKMIELRLNDQFNEKKDQDAQEKDEDSEAEEREPEVQFNYQRLLFYKAYYELILDEWNAGHTLTIPTPILGVDCIQPHPYYRYSKPILMLINELDFSGGDFIPAILKDGKRATLFGMRTAGAGGCVEQFQFPNEHGIAGCSYTFTLAERTNKQKIENLGVTPDIEYRISVQDLKNDYCEYAKAVNQAVQGLLEKNLEEQPASR